MDLNFGGESNPNQLKVNLSISCLGLVSLDALSKSDPMVIVYIKDNYGMKPWEEVGRTELLKNQKDPKFTQTITMPYRFEEVQNLKFVCVDVDDPKHSFDVTEFRGKKDFIGSVETTLGNIMGCKGNTLMTGLHCVELF